MSRTELNRFREPVHMLKCKCRTHEMQCRQPCRLHFLFTGFVTGFITGIDKNFPFSKTKPTAVFSRVFH